MRLFVAVLLLLTTLSSCKKSTGDSGDYAYFGGEIINPSNDFVLLYDTKDVVDTLYLDHNNRFLQKIANVEPGLYTFVHGGEYQWILLEPRDSILLRLNTNEFDESLVFTGIGARKNNYLVKTFLDNEAENRKFRTLCQMEPEKFEHVLDSIRNKKLNELHEFLSEKEYSDLFKSIAENSINYNYYANKEMYPFGYYGYGNLIHHNDLPEGFYDFRRDVDYNIQALSEFYTYNQFLYSHFNNLALQKFYETHTHHDAFNSKSLVYNLEKLKLIDSLVSNERIKNNLLKLTTRNFISMSDDSTEIQELMQSYLQKTSNEKDKAMMNALMHSVKGLRRGNTLPRLALVNYDDHTVILDSIIKKPTVIYFWSSTLPQLMRNSHYKVTQLRTKFPNIDFIGININDDDNTHWKNILDEHKFLVNSEFQFKDPNEAQQALAINSVNKSILVNKDSKIINANALLFTSEFEEQLKELMHYKK